MCLGQHAAGRGFCLLGLIEVGRRHLGGASFTVEASSYRFAAASFGQMSFPPEVIPAPPQVPSLPCPERRSRVPSALGRSWGSESLRSVPPGGLRRREGTEGLLSRSRRRRCWGGDPGESLISCGPEPQRGPVRALRGGGRVPGCPCRRSVLVRNPVQPQKPPHPSARYFLPGPSLSMTPLVHARGPHPLLSLIRQPRPRAPKGQCPRMAARERP